MDEDTIIKKETLNKQIGRRVRDMREYHEMTREQLAEYADISVQFLSTIESGQKSMTTHTLYKMATALNVTTDYLVTGETFSEGSDRITLLIETLSPDEKAVAERLIQFYLRGLYLRETSVEKRYEKKS